MPASTTARIRQDHRDRRMSSAAVRKGPAPIPVGASPPAHHPARRAEHGRPRRRRTPAGGGVDRQPALYLPGLGGRGLAVRILVARRPTRATPRRALRTALGRDRPRPGLLFVEHQRTTASYEIVEGDPKTAAGRPAVALARAASLAHEAGADLKTLRRRHRRAPLETTTPIWLPPSTQAGQQEGPDPRFRRSDPTRSGAPAGTRTPNLLIRSQMTSGRTYAV
jgi:hypothetical protein